MKKFEVTLDYTATITIEAESAEEAEELARGTDATEILQDLGEGLVIDVREEE